MNLAKNTLVVTKFKEENFKGIIVSDLIDDSFCEFGESVVLYVYKVKNIETGNVIKVNEEFLEKVE